MLHWKSKQVKRHGLPPMTRCMAEVLAELRAAQQADMPFIHLPDLHYRTRRSLILRDWIFASPGLDGTRYKITGRGLKALAVYEQPIQRRDDGLCPTCGVRPRKVAKTGYVYGYCAECQRLHDNRQFALKGHQLDPNSLCPRCGERPRYRYPSGFIIAYCYECRAAMRQDERRRKHARLLARIQAGEFIPCIRCKKCPRYHTDKLVYDYCHECYRAQQNDYNRRKQTMNKEVQPDATD